MSNQVAVFSARDFIRQGGKFGNFTATSYELQGDRVALIAGCNECSAKNRIPWSHVASELRTPGTLPCINKTQHRAVSKPVIDWQSMTPDEFRNFVKRLPADEYLRLSKNAAFVARDTPNQYIDRSAAIQQKEAHDREMKLAPYRQLWKRLFMICTGTCKRPVDTFEQFCALKPEQREAIITQYNLREDDGLVWRPEA